MLRTLDGHGRVELDEVPHAVGDPQRAAQRTGEHPGHLSHHVRRRRHRGCRCPPAHLLGAELVGDLAQYEDSYRLCFVRGLEGIILGLAEQLG